MGPAASHLELVTGLRSPPGPGTSPSAPRGERGDRDGTLQSNLWLLVQLSLGVRPSVNERQVHIETTGLLPQERGHSCLLGEV